MFFLMVPLVDPKVSKINLKISWTTRIKGVLGDWNFKHKTAFRGRWDVKTSTIGKITEDLRQENVNLLHFGKYIQITS